MADDKKELVTTQGASEQMPAFMRGRGSQGSDNFDATDVVIPRIKLLQGISPEVEAYDHAKSGEFWFTGLDESVGPNFRFVIADRRKKYLLSAPLEDGQGVLARADDAVTWDRTGKWSVKLKGVKQPVTWEIVDKDVQKSGLASWGTYNPDDEDSPPAATLFYDYLVFLPDHLEYGPAVISLARSQIKPAKKGLNDKITLHKSQGRPLQGLIFEAVSVNETSDSGDFKNWSFRSGGFVQDEALFNMAMEHAGSLATVKIGDEASTDEKPVVHDDGEGKF
jgi:hypothetical protein